MRCRWPLQRRWPWRTCACHACPGAPPWADGCSGSATARRPPLPGDRAPWGAAPRSCRRPPGAPCRTRAPSRALRTACVSSWLTSLPCATPQRASSISPGADQVNPAMPAAVDMRRLKMLLALTRGHQGPQPEAREDPQRQEKAEARPHYAVAKAVGHVPERDGAEGVADEADGAEDADRAAAPGLGRHVHDQRREGGIEKARRAPG